MPTLLLLWSVSLVAVLATNMPRCGAGWLSNTVTLPSGQQIHVANSVSQLPAAKSGHTTANNNRAQQCEPCPRPPHSPRTCPTRPLVEPSASTTALIFYRFQNRCHDTCHTTLTIHVFVLGICTAMEKRPTTPDVPTHHCWPCMHHKQRSTWVLRKDGGMPFLTKTLRLQLQFN